MSRIASVTFGLDLATGTLQMTTVWQIPRNVSFGHRNPSKHSSKSPQRTPNRERARINRRLRSQHSKITPRTLHPQRFYASEASSNVSGRNFLPLESGPGADYPI